MRVGLVCIRKQNLNYFIFFKLKNLAFLTKKLNEWQVFALRKIVVFYTSNFGGKLQIVLGVSAKNTLGKKKMEKNVCKINVNIFFS